MKTTSIITTLRARVAMTLLLAITTFTGAWASQFITDVVLIGGSKSEVNNLKAAYQSKGWTVIDKDLNDGCGSTSDYIYLLYKTADNFENSPNLTFITGFYLTNESGHLSEDRMINDLPYHLVPYDGGSHFKSVQGNLNSNCIPTSSDIHLYYTTAGLDSKEAIYDIYFSNDEWGDGVVGKNGDNAKGYDLNAGCGKLSAYIFMHCKSYKSNYWNIITSSDFSQCRITGIEEEVSAKKSIKSVPAIINGAKVIDIYPSVNLSTISNLETIYFTDAFEPTEMLSAKNCKKLTNIDVVDNNGTVIRADELPNRITSIPAEAFANSTIKNLKMPNVTNIGNAAFLNCDSLESVTISNKVTSIGESAFNSCSSLTSITIPDNVTSIGYEAFANCSSMKSVTIGKGINSFNRTAFHYDIALESIIVTSGNPTYDSRDNSNAIIEKATNTLIYGCKNTVIPNSVTSIGYEAFEQCTSLTSIDIPNSVTSIGTYAFSNCTGLTSIEIPNSITTIEEYTFNACKGLTSVTLPNSITRIQNNAFQYCSSLPSIVIPKSVRHIGEDAFFICTGMTDVYCYANPDSLRWPENDCDDFIKEGGVTKCHVFNTEEWNNFRDTVNVEFVGDLVIDLPDNANNDAFLKSWNNRKVNMTLQGRTFFKEGLCNTLCLPFTVTDKNADVGGDLQSPTFAGTPFEGAMVMTLDNTSFSNGTLTLNFRNVRTIEAGKPYIIKWQPVNSNDGTAILSFSNPTFYDVTITSTTPKAISSNGAVTFKGCLSPLTLGANNRTKLYLGENNTLYYPCADVTINACRAWFQLASPITSIGDMNGDRGINVTDVTSLVNHILGTASSNFIIDNADVNNDGGINVTDVTSLVNIILNNNDNIYNVVVNVYDDTITYDGSSNNAPMSGENHIWDE